MLPRKEWLLARHRGSNRPPEERKTDAETSDPAADGKTKERYFSEKARWQGMNTAASSPQSRKNRNGALSKAGFPGGIDEFPEDFPTVHSS